MGLIGCDVLLVYKLTFVFQRQKKKHKPTLSLKYSGPEDAMVLKNLHF
jgi:hypothetical protein